MSAVRRGPLNLEPQIRGLQETEVAMLVDGSRNFAAGPGRMDSDFSHLSLHAVDRVHIVKGPYALTWGAGALAAIDLRTRRAPFAAANSGRAGAPGVRAGVHYTENGEALDAYGQILGSSERVRYSLLYNHRQGDDYESGDGTLVPSDYESYETRGSFGLRLGSNGRLDYSIGYQSQEDIDYPGRLLDATYFKNRSHVLEYGWSGASGALLEGFAQASVNRKDHLMNNEEKPTGRDMAGRIPSLCTRHRTSDGVEHHGGAWLHPLRLGRHQAEGRRRSLHVRTDSKPIRSSPFERLPDLRRHRVAQTPRFVTPACTPRESAREIAGKRE